MWIFCVTASIYATSTGSTHPRRQPIPAVAGSPDDFITVGQCAQRRVFPCRSVVVYPLIPSEIPQNVGIAFSVSQGIPTYVLCMDRVSGFAIFVGGFLRAAGHPHDHAQLTPSRLILRFACSSASVSAIRQTCRHGLLYADRNDAGVYAAQPGNLERFEVACRFRKRSVVKLYSSSNSSANWFDSSSTAAALWLLPVYRPGRLRYPVQGVVLRPDVFQNLVERVANCGSAPTPEIATRFES